MREVRSMLKKSKQITLKVGMAVICALIFTLLCHAAVYASNRYSYSLKTIGTTANRGKNRKALIRRYDKVTGKTKTIKTIRLKPGRDVTTQEWFELVGVYDNRMYLNRIYYENLDGYSIYMLNLKTKKLKKVADKAYAVAQKGKYLVSKYDYVSTPLETVLYKSVKTGLKKVKRLAKYGKIGCISGNYVYYIAYPNQESASGAIYRIRFDGKKKKLMARFKNRSIIEVTTKGYEYQSGWTMKQVSFK